MWLLKTAALLCTCNLANRQQSKNKINWRKKLFLASKRTNKRTNNCFDSARSCIVCIILCCGQPPSDARTSAQTVTHCEINQARASDSSEEANSKERERNTPWNSIRAAKTTKTLQKMFTPLTQLKSNVLSLIGTQLCSCKVKETHHLKQQSERNNCFRKLKKLYKLEKNCSSYWLLKQDSSQE